MHSLIVALLCLTLFVDSAKACWWLRHHRCRAQACRPATCPAPARTCCDTASGEFVTVGHAVAEPVFADDPSNCLCGDAIVEHVVVEGGVGEAAIPEQATAEHDVARAIEQAAAAPTADGVVVHGPTIVIDTAPRKPAGDVESKPEPTSEPKSVVAQPMPVAATSPASLPKPAPAGEPVPDLKPAIAPLAPVAPVSNEQPSPEPTEKPATPAPAVAVPAAPAAAPVEAAAPMPAPADDLAGGPDATLAKQRSESLAKPVPQEPNLFDVYADEADEETDAVEESPAEAAAAEEPKMTDPEPTESEPTKSAESTSSPEGETSAPAPADEEADKKAESVGKDASDDKPAEEPAESPKDDESPAESDPFKAAFAVPDEPIRRWSDDSGTHHAQGWLVEVRADSVRILKVNGRHTTVARESLSGVDRDYVSAVGDRLAAERQGVSPATTTTAGLERR